MELSDFNTIINLILDVMAGVFTSLDGATLINSPAITLLDICIGMSVFAEIWYLMVDVKDGAV